MNLFSHLSIKSKLTLMVLAISLATLAVMGYFSWRTTQSTLMSVVSTHLADLRSLKAHQVETYFETVDSQIRVLSQNEMMVSAMNQFRDGFQKLEEEPLPATADREIERYYTENYFPALAQSVQGTPDFETYRPRTHAERYLQYHYVLRKEMNNPVDTIPPLSSLSDNDGTGLATMSGSEVDYARSHQHYDDRIRSLSLEFGFSDLLLIDHETGDVIYSVQKDTTLGRNLASGPYRQSHLAKAVESVQANPERGVIQGTDFVPYRPQFGMPVAFLATSIHDGRRSIGILVVQLSLDKIDALMTNNGEWPEMGLKLSSESYLVGPDQRMRSSARFLRENLEDYFNNLNSGDTGDGGTVNGTMEALLNASILLQTVDTKAAQAAVGGQSGTLLSQNYLGHDVLSAYGSLDFGEDRWAILTEIDAVELMQPIYRQQQQLLVTLTVLALALSILMVLFASLFTRPLSQLIASTKQAVDGATDTVIDLPGHDEFATLSKHIGGLVGQVQTQTNLVTEKEHRYEGLLQSIVPSRVAGQLQRGEARIANRVQQVTVLSARLSGLTELDETWSANAVADLFSEVVASFYDSSSQMGLDSPTVVGEQFIVVCGLTTPRLDHAKRTVDFAQEMLEILRRVNERHQTNLQLQIGIHSGPMTAGLLSNQLANGWFSYNVWGKTLNMAAQLSVEAGPNVVITSQAVYERVGQICALVEYRILEDAKGERMMSWALASSLRMPQEQIFLVQTSFAKVLPIADSVSEDFYKHLFELDPDLRSFFKSDLVEQQRKLMATLQVVISGLGSPEKIIPAAQDLGRRHVDYGVHDEHYDVVGKALLHALDKNLGDDLTPSMHAAWGELYERISSAMKMAAADLPHHSRSRSNI